MATLKCKMCGGDIIVVEGSSTLECEHCGVMQTVPNVSDEKKGRMFDRANLLRRNNEFDKATILYEDIISEYPEEAEGYWGLVLCKYGIEYVDDALTGKKLPTCHRTLTTPVEEDGDFRSTLEHASTLARETYIAEAREIDRIQKKILAIASREEPYDIFICYKETDEFGLRTDDSGMAQDIYTELIREGYKVFFSRVTLKGKSGTEYEPYIYSALSSARVMLVIGTCYEYFESVWVKNEWSRYLAMMSADSTQKTLIPCIKGILVEDLPPRLKNLQALTVTDVTFYKNLMDSIRRAIPDRNPTQSGAKVASAGNVTPLLKRTSIFLSDGDFESAAAYCEKVLDLDPENSRAYLYKFMAEKKLKNELDVLEQKGELLENGVFSHAYNYAKGEEKQKLDSFIESARENMRRQIEENEAQRQKWLCEGIDRAAEQTAAGDFEHALASVRPALEDSTRHARAYLISLLARNKCKSECELVCRGVSVAADEDYARLIERSEGDERTYYEELGALSDIGHILVFADALTGAVTDDAKTAIALYADRFGRDAVRECAEKLLCYDADLRGMGALTLRYGEELKKRIRDTAHVCTECADALVEGAVAATGKLYRYINAEVIRHINIGSYSVKNHTGGFDSIEISILEDCWADPVSNVEGLGEVNISYDGEGALPSERYISLARYLYKTNGVGVTERIDRLLGRAVELCPPDMTEQIESARTELYIDMANSNKADVAAAERISDLDPDNAALAWACAEKITAGFSRITAKNYDTDAAYDKLVQRKKKYQSASELKAKLDALREELASLDREEADVLTSADRMAQRAIAKSEDKSEEYKNTYDSYISSVKEKFKSLKGILTQRIATLEKLFKGAYRKGKCAVVFRSIVSSVFSVAFAVSAVWMLIYAASGALDPMSLLEQSGVLYVVIGVAVMLIGSNIALRILTSFARGLRKKLNKLEPKNVSYLTSVGRVYGVFKLTKDKPGSVLFNVPGVCKIINVIAPYVVLVASIAAAGLFAYGPFALAREAEVVSITEPEQIVYIKNHPYLEYRIDADLDFTGKDIDMDTVYYFTGKIDGGGHTLSSFTLESDFCRIFKGELVDIVIEDADLKGNLVSSNAGDITGVSVKNSTFSVPLVDENNSKLSQLSAEGCIYTADSGELPAYNAILVAKNEDDGTVIDCKVTGGALNISADDYSRDTIYIGAVVADNNGGLYSSTVSTPLDINITQTEKSGCIYAAALVGHSSAEIIGCSATSPVNIEFNETATLEDSFYSSSSANFYFEIGGLCGYGEVSRSSYEGSIKINGKSSKSDYRTMNMDMYYYVGGLTNGASIDSYSKADIDLTYTSYQNDPARKYLYVGYLNGTGKVTNCYSESSASLNIEGKEYDGVGMVGAYSNIEPWVNSIVIVEDVNTQYKSFQEGYNKSKAVNCYSNNGGGYNKEGKEIVDMNFEDMYTVDFFVETLGLSREIWDIKDGELPTLLPYVHSFEEDEETTDTVDTALTSDSNDIKDKSEGAAVAAPEA